MSLLHMAVRSCSTALVRPARVTCTGWLGCSALAPEGTSCTALHGLSGCGRVLINLPWSMFSKCRDACCLGMRTLCPLCACVNLYLLNRPGRSKRRQYYSANPTPFIATGGAAGDVGERGALRAAGHHARAPRRHAHAPGRAAARSGRHGRRPCRCAAFGMRCSGVELCSGAKLRSGKRHLKQRRESTDHACSRGRTWFAHAFDTDQSRARLCAHSLHGPRA